MKYLVALGVQWIEADNMQNAANNLVRKILSGNTKLNVHAQDGTWDQKRVDLDKVVEFQPGVQVTPCE